MWRALFLALGISMVILGGEFLIIDRAVLKRKVDPADAPPPAFLWTEAPPMSQQKVVKPAEWAPWSLISGGVVVILYSITIPRRSSG